MTLFERILSWIGVFAAKVGEGEFIVLTEPKLVKKYSWNGKTTKYGKSEFAFDYANSYYGGTFSTRQAERFVEWAAAPHKEKEIL